MHYFRTPFQIVLILFLLIPGLSAASELPDPYLGTYESTIERLTSLYSLDSMAAHSPMEIHFAPSTGLAQIGWGGLPAFAAGAAIPSQSRIVVIPSRAGRYPFGSVAQTFRHEISHVLLFRALGYRAPRWLDEGLAMRVAGEWGSEDEWFLAFGLPTIAQGKDPLGKIEQDFHEGESRVRRSYAISRAFVRELFANDYEIQQFILAARERRSVEEAFRTRFGMSSQEAFEEWASERPLWRDLFVALGSEKSTWFFALGLFFLAGVLGIIRRRRSFDRLPE